MIVAKDPAEKDKQLAGTDTKGWKDLLEHCQRLGLYNEPPLDTSSQQGEALEQTLPTNAQRTEVPVLPPPTEVPVLPQSIKVPILPQPTEAPVLPQPTPDVPPPVPDPISEPVLAPIQPLAPPPTQPVPALSQSTKPASTQEACPAPPDPESASTQKAHPATPEQEADSSTEEEFPWTPTPPPKLRAQAEAPLPMATPSSKEADSEEEIRRSLPPPPKTKARPRPTTPSSASAAKGKKQSWREKPEMLVRMQAPDGTMIDKWQEYDPPDRCGRVKCRRVKLSAEEVMEEGEEEERATVVRKRQKLSDGEIQKEERDELEEDEEERTMVEATIHLPSSDSTIEIAGEDGQNWIGYRVGVSPSGAKKILGQRRVYRGNKRSHIFVEAMADAGQSIIEVRILVPFTGHLTEDSQSSPHLLEDYVGQITEMDPTDADIHLEAMGLDRERLMELHEALDNYQRKDSDTP